MLPQIPQGDFQVTLEHRKPHCDFVQQPRFPPELTPVNLSVLLFRPVEISHFPHRLAVRRYHRAADFLSDDGFYDPAQLEAGARIVAGAVALLAY